MSNTKSRPVLKNRSALEKASSRFFPSRLTLGHRAERAALEYLHARGCVLIARNVRFRVGEIDLVVREGGCLVFVEVRSRGEGAWENAEIALPFAKRMRLWRAIELYLSRMAPADLRAFRTIRVDYLATDGVNWFWRKNIELPSG
jgi:putative endonuclease